MAASRPAVVGSFVMGALVLAVAAILFFGGTQIFAKSARAVIFFEGSVAGLDVGAPVTFRGVRVGSVQSIALRLSVAGEAHIPVVIDLVPGQVTIEGTLPQSGGQAVSELVAAGLRAQLNLQSFVTGQLRVDLDFRPNTPAQMENYDTYGLPQIPALKSDLERIRATLSELPVAELAKSTERTLRAVEHLSERLDQQMGPLLDSTRQTLDSANQAMRAFQQAVTALQSDVARSLQHVDSLTVDAQRQLDDRSGDLQKILVSTQQAVKQADSLLATLNSMTAPRSQIRGDLEASVRDLAASASSLRGFAHAIERDPSALLKGRNGP